MSIQKTGSGDPMRFEFATATRVIFGTGVLREFQPAQFGKRALVVGGRTASRLSPLFEILDRAGVAFDHYAVDGEPTLDLISRGIDAARKNQADFVIGFGGGSSIDAGKAIAAMMNNPGDLTEYLEVIGNSKPLLHPPLPYIAIPTTAGTGAEATRNAVLASPSHRLKVSVRSPLMLPRLALVDPELTKELSPALTASTGMDALTQLIEPYVSIRANAMTDALCLDGLRRVARSLRRACSTPEDMTARTDMSLASLFSGMALANAGLGAVHGFAAAIGGMFSAPHGAICAVLLAPVIRANIEVLRHQQPISEHLARYREIGRLLTGKPEAEAKDAIEWVAQLCQDLHIPRLSSYRISRNDAGEICRKAAATSSMKGNPVVLDQRELESILTEAL